MTREVTRTERLVLAGGRAGDRGRGRRSLRERRLGTCSRSCSRRSRWRGSRGWCRSPPSRSGERFGPAVTGLMQSTLGNLPEFFVVIFALNAGQLIVAQTAILGSILVNALLVLGLVIVAGARTRRDGRDALQPAAAERHRDAAAALDVHHRPGRRSPTRSHDPASHHIKTISIVGAVAILVVYGAVAAPVPQTASAARRRPAAPPRDRQSGVAGAARGRRHGVGVRLGLVRPRARADDPQLHISQAFAGL